MIRPIIIIEQAANVKTQVAKRTIASVISWAYNAQNIVNAKIARIVIRSMIRKKSKKAKKI